MLKENFKMWNFKFYLSKNTALKGSWCNCSFVCLELTEGNQGEASVCLVFSFLQCTKHGISQTGIQKMLCDLWFIKKTVESLLFTLEDGVGPRKILWRRQSLERHVLVIMARISLFKFVLEFWLSLLFIRAINWKCCLFWTKRHFDSFILVKHSTIKTHIFKSNF